MNASTYRLLADLVLVLHVSFVVFVVLGLIVIICGGVRSWAWIRNPWFRTAHLGAIGVVVVQAWLGVICPLTTLEMHLRERTGDSTYEGTFIAHWLHKLLYFEVPLWVFVVVYTLFALAVVYSWLKFRPRGFRSNTQIF
ncbi:MAG: DUF2784 domain-containing protein [Verrucomicrobiota bacterium]